MAALCAAVVCRNDAASIRWWLPPLRMVCESQEHESLKGVDYEGGEPAGTRTQDPLIKSQVL